MTIGFTPLHPLFAAECSGIDIAQPLSPAAASAIEDAMDRYAVLVFRRGVPLTTEQQIAFSKALGELEPPYTRIQAADGMRLDSAALSDISNLAPGDKILAADDRKRLFNMGNQLWHADSSYKVNAARYSILCAHVIPPEGGDTEFADMRLAWDALDPWLKEKVRSLVVEHSRLYSKGTMGVPFTAEE
jgi:alpha-ketoglutarate-dependent 2,4-dichlorophenoxyacetate dioxygenase